MYIRGGDLDRAYSEDSDSKAAIKCREKLIEWMYREIYAGLCKSEENKYGGDD